MQTSIIKLETSELDALEPSKSAQIKAIFEPMTRVLDEFEEQYRNVLRDAKDGITQRVMFDARGVRLSIAKVRTDTEKLRVAQKDEYVIVGKAIDGVANLLKWATKDKEKKLQEIEDHITLQAEKAHEALQIEREGSLKPYITADVQLSGLADMVTDVWDIYLEGKKKEYNDRLQAEKKAETERIEKQKAAAAERARILAENERLKKEADEREIVARKERADRAAAEAKREAALNQERKEREELARKEHEIFEQKIKLEREEKERIKAEACRKEEVLEQRLKDPEPPKPLKLAFSRHPTRKSKLENRMVEVLNDILSVIYESKGIYGYHLNGDGADWDEFEFKQEIEQILADLKNETA